MSCPSCQSGHIFQSAYGFSVCRVCGHQWVHNNEKYLESYIEEELVSCHDCWGTGKIYAYVGDSKPGKCSSCSGTGWMGIVILPEQGLTR